MKEPATEPGTQLPAAQHTLGPRPRERFLLWVDGVGGFLICLAPRVVLGHAALDSDVDVPILAEVSRQHALIERDAHGYVLEAMRSAQVNQKAVTRTILHTNDQITLGRSCQFVFSQAVPVSASARLDLVSGHRLWRALQGVLLMADTLVLGPGSQSHVCVPELREPMVVHRRGKGLALRCPGKLWVNDKPAVDRCDLEPGSRVATEELSLFLEVQP
jgi:hypothetical protein